MQVDVYDDHAKGEASFQALVRSVRIALDLPRDGNFLDTDRDDYEDDTKLDRKSYDVRVWYREA